MKKRTFPEMVQHFNTTVSQIDMPLKDRMTLFGIIVAMEQKYEEDAANVKHGHWEKERIGADKIDKCSVCGSSYLPCIKSYNYCPFCGAKMDEVTE